MEDIEQLWSEVIKITKKADKTFLVIFIEMDKLLFFK